MLTKDTKVIDDVENSEALLILWYFYDLRNNEQEKYETYKKSMDSILNWFCMEHYSDGNIKWFNSDESDKTGCLAKFCIADKRRYFYNFFFYYKWFMGRSVAKKISDLLQKDIVVRDKNNDIYTNRYDKAGSNFSSIYMLEKMNRFIGTSPIEYSEAQPK